MEAVNSANNAIQLPISTDLPVYFCDSIMCRLCGCTGLNVSFILLKESSYLAKKIHYETGVKIKDTDILPKTICGGCTEKVHLIRHFKRHCRKTQRVLQEMYEERYHGAKVQRREAPIIVENSIVVDDDNEEKIVVEFVDNSEPALENTSVQNAPETITSNYGHLFNNTNRVNTVYSPVPTAFIYHDKVLGQMTKPRVQTYSKQELQQLSTKQIMVEEIDDDESESQNDEPESQIDEPESQFDEPESQNNEPESKFDESELQFEGELELTDMIVKTETEIKIENAPQKTEESAEQMQTDDTSDEVQFYGKIEVPTNNSPLLYTLLTNKKSEPDFILPHHFETIEEQNNGSTETTEETNQSTVDVDDDIEIVSDNKLDDESKLATFIISKVVSTTETFTDTEASIRIDRLGKTCSSNSHGYIQKIADKEYACKICNEKFRYPFQAEIHVKRHIGELPFKCKSCEKSFVNEYNLYKHERTHTTGQYICEICGQSFHESYAFNEHQKMHTQPKPEFKCSKCDKVFITKANFDSHMLIHEEKKYVCEICGKEFPVLAMMRRHEARHKEDTVFKCNLCPKICKTKDQYTQHKKRHDEQGRFHCKSCSLSFWTLKGLHVHETVRHNGDVQTEMEDDINTEVPNAELNEDEDK